MKTKEEKRAWWVAYDEGIAESDDDPFTPGAELMEKIMGTPIDWAPGLPLKAEGFESRFYRKG